MWVPFQNELDETFRSDGSIWLKIGGCAFAAVVVVVAGAFRFARQANVKVELTTPMIGILAGGSAVLGALIGLALSLKDTVSNRLSRGERVHPILRTYFGGGTLCLVVWFVSVIFLAMVVTFVGLSMGLF